MKKSSGGLEYPLENKRINSRGQSVVYEDYKKRMHNDKVKKQEIIKQQKELEKIFNEP